MNPDKRKKLEAAGWRVGDAADFLGLSEDEARLVELRVELGRAIRKGREARKWTQKELAAAIGTTQPRVAKIEAAAPEVSLDLMARGFFAVGGHLFPDLNVTDLPAGRSTAREKSAPARERSRKSVKAKAKS